MKQQDDWTQQLRRQLADSESAVPEGLWDNIEASLPRQRKPATVVWLRRTLAVAASVLLLVGIALYWPEQTDTVALYEQPNEESTPAETLLSREVEPPGLKPSLAQNRSTKRPKGRLNHLGERKANITTLHPTSLDEAEETDELPEEKTEATSTEKQPSAVHKEYPSENNKRRKEQKTMLSSEKRAPKLMLALNGSSNLGNLNSTSPVLMSHEMALRYSPLMSRSDENIYLTDYSEEEDHAAPITFGLTATYPLARHWLLSSGITYTLTSSKFTTHIRGQEVTRSQHVDYIGIPLNLHYSVWQHRRWLLYGSAGMQADFCIKAKSKQDGIKTEMEKDRMRWSAHLAAGVQFNLWPTSGIYIEPGLRYYFDNGSPLRNAMSERPLDFSMQVGYRLTIR